MKIKKKYYQYIGLIYWCVLRHKYYIPIFLMMQIVLSVAIIYGLSFLTNTIDFYSISYLYIGAITINILAVTCVLSPQIVSESKQNGILEYEKTLPISRISILLSETIIWGLLSIVGTIFCIIIGAFRFQMKVNITISGIFTLLFVTLSLVLFGFAIAYLLQPSLVNIVTQLIMMGGLFLSPIIYPEERLPQWSVYCYNYLPFVPVNRLIRFHLFQVGEVVLRDYFVVFLWGILSFFIAILILVRRK